MKTNLDHYPHKSGAHRHPKFKMLRSMFGSIAEGWAAEGRFWALNNIIASADYCVLDLTKKRNRGAWAEELGMTLVDFNTFIEILKSEEVQLINEIQKDIYTTDIIQETYESVYKSRQSALDRYYKSKESVDITAFQENIETSPEVLKTSPEARYKVKGSEVKGIEGNRREGKGSEENGQTSETFSLITSSSEKKHIEEIESLFKTYTKIHDPNEQLHVLPIMNLYRNIPEHLTEHDMTLIFSEVFKSLNRNTGIKMEYLINNLQRKITEKHEYKLNLLKKNEITQGKKDRIISREAKLKEESEARVNLKSKYKEFVSNNRNLFTDKELIQIGKSFETGSILPAGAIIEPKIKEFEKVAES